MWLTKIYRATKIEKNRGKTTDKYRWCFMFSSTLGETPINPSLPYRQRRIYFCWFHFSDQLAHTLLVGGCEMYSLSLFLIWIYSGFKQVHGGWALPRSHALFPSYTCVID